MFRMIVIISSLFFLSVYLPKSKQTKQTGSVIPFLSGQSVSYALPNFIICHSLPLASTDIFSPLCKHSTSFHNSLPNSFILSGISFEGLHLSLQFYYFGPVQISRHLQWSFPTIQPLSLFRFQGYFSTPVREYLSDFVLIIYLIVCLFWQTF